MRFDETYFSLLFHDHDVRLFRGRVCELFHPHVNVHVHDLFHDHDVRLFRGRVCELFHLHANAHVHVSCKHYRYVMPYYDLDNF